MLFKLLKIKIADKDLLGMKTVMIRLDKILQGTEIYMAVSYTHLDVYKRQL